MKTLKIATFNIQHCENFNTEKIDFDAYADYIRSLDADIIGLNEVRGKGARSDYEAQASILAEKTGYDFYFAKATEIGEGNPYGNAVLTRLKIKNAETVPIPDPAVPAYDGYYETRCLLKLTLEDPALTVLITHFGLNPDEHENAVKTIAANIPEGSCILMGDLNVTPDNAVLDPVRALLKDSAAAADDALLSFPSDAPDRKIDYIFVSGNIGVKDVFVPDVVLSDHRPMRADIEL